MAAPTPSPNSVMWDGQRGSLLWRAAWAGADDFTDSAVVDISTLAPAPNSIKIRSIDAMLDGDFTLTLEFDATTDQMIEIINGQTDVSNYFRRDYTDGPNAGLVPSNTAAAGFTGDLLLTTANVASGDELNLYVVFEKSS